MNSLLFLVLEQPVFEAVSKSEPAGFNDICGTADGAPFFRAVSGFDEHADQRFGTGAFCEDTDFIIDEFDNSEVGVEL